MSRPPLPSHTSADPPAGDQPLVVNLLLGMAKYHSSHMGTTPGIELAARRDRLNSAESHGERRHAPLGTDRSVDGAGAGCSAPVACPPAHTAQDNAEHPTVLADEPAGDPDAHVHAHDRCMRGQCRRPGMCGRRRSLPRRPVCPVAHTPFHRSAIVVPSSPRAARASARPRSRAGSSRYGTGDLPSIRASSRQAV